MRFFKRIFGRERRSRETDPIDEELRCWKIVSLENERLGNVVIRIRIEKPPIPTIEQYKFSVAIDWPYESAGEMPEPETKSAMDRFEVMVEALSSDNDLSYLIVVSTGMGVRRWLYYTRDVDQFMDQFNRLIDGSPVLPLKLETNEDPHWSEWQNLVNDIVERMPDFLVKR